MLKYDHYRNGEELSSENPVGIYCPQLPLPLNYEGMQYTYPEVTIHASDSEATSSTLPPSLTAFLVGFCNKAAEGTLFVKYKFIEHAWFTFKNLFCLIERVCRNAAEAPKLAEEVDLKSQMVVLSEH